MKYRIGLILIILSYLCFGLDIYFFPKIADEHMFIRVICLGITMSFLYFGFYLAITKKESNTNEHNKLDKVLKVIAYIPLVILLAIPTIIIFLILFVICGEKTFVQKTKPLRKLGYKMEKRKENKQKVYYFKYDELILKFVPNEIYDISFDSGKTFVPIIETNIGTYEEIEHLKTIQHQYETADYRDKDCYDLTTEYVKFIVKNITPNK